MLMLCMYYIYICIVTYGWMSLLFLVYAVFVVPIFYFTPLCACIYVQLILMIIKKIKNRNLITKKCCEPQIEMTNDMTNLQIMKF